MNVFLLPPEKHFDGGLGMTASEFKRSAGELKETKGMALSHLPVCYLQRHSIELYLKSLIFILHKKFQVPFGDGFSIEKPAVLINGKWKLLSNTHNLADLYSYFIDLFESVITLMPTSTDWTIDPKIKTKINLINGYDPNSTYFRYPKALDERRDRLKSGVQSTDIEVKIAQANSRSSKPIKCVVMLNENDEVVETYDLASDAITDVRNALDETVEFMHDIHCAFLGELTRWT
ncbi:hypothetical protein QUO07_004301 [Vibrio parahaemolyticus]|nr:hypothetical protein [Vibrio parahaemolyticus]